ncbi:MAG: hypothetical protein ACLGIA_02920 [Actinomycetes bacterium]
MADRRRLPVARLVLLVPGGLALLAGLDAALMLLGLPAPVRADRLPEVHGVLLVLGFVGTIVALERAVALGRAWGFLSPAALGLGGLLLLTPAPLDVGRWLLVAGAAVLVAVYRPLWRRAPAAAVLVQAGGAVLGTGGALLWAGGVPVPWLLPWLVGFLVLTIAGERVELARVGALQAGAERAALAVATAVLVATLAALLWPVAGYALLGASLLGLAAWLSRFDVARRTVRGTGLPRYMAVCLLAGYAWLAVVGATWLLRGPVVDGGGYDVVVHAVFLGFVMSMVMAHAPVILPAVLRRPLPYHPALYGPVVLLHTTLVLRTAVGDVHGVRWAWQAGGVGNIVAVLAFVALVVWSLLAGGRRPSRPQRTPTDPTVAPGRVAVEA